MSAIDRLMQDAPEEREDEPEPEPSPQAAQKTAEAQPEKKVAPPADDFHEDPLIKDAVEIFKGKLKS